MARFSICTDSREQLIAVGAAIAAAFRHTPHGRPWMVCVNGDSDAGKSLLALAMLQYLSPEHYPHGITDHKADDNLWPHHAMRPTVVFINLNKAVASSRKGFDAVLGATEGNEQHEHWEPAHAENRIKVREQGAKFCSVP